MERYSDIETKGQTYHQCVTEVGRARLISMHDVFISEGFIYFVQSPPDIEKISGRDGMEAIKTRYRAFSYAMS